MHSYTCMYIYTYMYKHTYNHTQVDRILDVQRPFLLNELSLTFPYAIDFRMIAGMALEENVGKTNEYGCNFT